MEKRPHQLRVLGLVDDTHAALAELLGDLVVRDGLADHNGPILPPYGVIVITTDVMNDDIFSCPGA